MQNVIAHKSLTGHYISDFTNLVYKKLVPFQNRLTVNLYQLDVENSQYDDNLQSFYHDVNSKQFGGKFTLVLDFPIYMATSTNLVSQSDERGMRTASSSNITVIADPLNGITVKNGDLIAFQINSDGYFGVYRVLENDDSATLDSPYKRLNLILLPMVNIDSLKSFIIDIKAFLPQYHKVFKKEEASMLIKLNHLILDYRDYFNGIYNNKLDAHVESYRAYLDWEYAFKYLIEENTHHLSNHTFYKSYLYYSPSLNSKYSIFSNLIGYDENNPIVEPYIFYYNNCIDKLSKIGIKTLNDSYKLYQIGCPCSSNDPSSQSIKLDQKTIDLYNMWPTIINDENFIDNVKDQMSKYLNNINVKSGSMISNLLSFSQVLYIMDRVIKFNEKDSRITT